MEIPKPVKKNRKKSVAITVRVDPDLLERVRRKKKDATLVSIIEYGMHKWLAEVDGK